MSDLTTTLPQPTAYLFGGKVYQIKPLTFNSLAKIEDRFGSLEKMDLTKIKDQRFLLFVILSSSEPELTEDVVGDLLTIDKMTEIVGFIRYALSASGLQTSEAEDATTGEAQADAGPAKARKALSPKHPV